MAQRWILRMNKERFTSESPKARRSLSLVALAERLEDMARDERNSQAFRDGAETFASIAEEEWKAIWRDAANGDSA